MQITAHKTMHSLDVHKVKQSKAANVVQTNNSGLGAKMIIPTIPASPASPFTSSFPSHLKGGPHSKPGTTVRKYCKRMRLLALEDSSWIDFFALSHVSYILPKVFNVSYYSLVQHFHIDDETQRSGLPSLPSVPAIMGLWQGRSVSLPRPSCILIDPKTFSDLLVLSNAGFHNG